MRAESSLVKEKMPDQICWVTPSICAEYIRTVLEVFFGSSRVDFWEMEVIIYPPEDNTRRVSFCGKYAQLGKPLPCVGFSGDLLLKDDSPKSILILFESQNSFTPGRINQCKAEWQGKSLVLIDPNPGSVEGQCIIGTSYHDRRVEPLQPKG